MSSSRYLPCNWNIQNCLPPPLLRNTRRLDTANTQRQLSARKFQCRRESKTRLDWTLQPSSIFLQRSLCKSHLLQRLFPSRTFLARKKSRQSLHSLFEMCQQCIERIFAPSLQSSQRHTMGLSWAPRLRSSTACRRRRPWPCSQPR